MNTKVFALHIEFTNESNIFFLELDIFIFISLL